MPTADVPETHDPINKEFEDATADFIAQKVSEELLMHPHNLLSEKALYDRFQYDLKLEFSQYKLRQNNGAIRLTASLNDFISEQPELFTDEIYEDIKKISNLPDIIQQDPAAFTKHIEEGKSLQEFAEISTITMDRLYMAAKRIYDRKSFTEAADAFYFLIGLNPQVYVFWLGLANSECNSNKFNDALTAYDVVAEATPHDASVYVAISQCYEALGQQENALKALDQALLAAQENQEFNDLKAKLEEEKLRLDHAR